MHRLIIRMDKLERKRPHVDINRLPPRDPLQHLLQTMRECLIQKLGRRPTDEEDRFFVDRFSEVFPAEALAWDDLDDTHDADRLAMLLDGLFEEMKAGFSTARLSFQERERAIEANLC